MKMRQLLQYKVALLVIFFLSTSMTSESNTDMLHIFNNTKELLYSNIWGSIYNSEKRQCDNTPTITGDGSHILPKRASKHRWIAISQEMLYSKYRQNLLLDKGCGLYDGKIRYGDTIWVDSPNKNINGWWVVHDTKNVTYRNSIDFLQTKGDGSLYNNNPLWNGKFENIRIYKLNNISYKQYYAIIND